MSTPPGMRARTAAPAPDSARAKERRDVRSGRPPLAQRLPGMTDDHLLSLQRAANRISQDPEHAKRRSAIAALPMIEAEIGRRAESLKASASDRK